MSEKSNKKRLKCFGCAEIWKKIYVKFHDEIIIVLWMPMRLTLRREMHKNGEKRTKMNHEIFKIKYTLHVYKWKVFFEHNINNIYETVWW